MIILLDDDIHKKISDNTLSNIEIECLSSLALSKKRGYNFVIASRPLLMSLSKYDKFSDQTKYTYQTIYHDQTRWFRLLSQFKFIIKLSSLAQEMNSTNLNDYITLTIPLKFFLDYSIDKKATIIAEHYSDIKLYKEMARSYLNHRKIKGISLTCSEALGGGSTTCEVVMNYLENFESISLCIVDSDLKSPWSGYGETATKVNGLKLSNDYARYLITKSREAENIIPTKLLLDIFDKNKVQKNKVTKYKKIREY
ncbi:hypothetical protein ACPV34_11325 [Photobacterium damselae]|uniref:hypothetical protein n=1 Tax=Photobacterium damselae TaxID=38293 RepID=UPI004069781F